MCPLFPNLATVTLAVVVAGSALAQRPAGEFVSEELAFRTYFYLTNRSVQDELKLTDEQKMALRKITDERNEAVRKARKETDPDARLAGTYAAFDKAEMATKKVLEPTQTRRLRQIYLQRAGTRSLTLPGIQKELKMAGKQVEEIRRIRQDAQAKSEALLDAARGDRDKLLQAIKQRRELRAKADAKVLNVLTPEQKKKWAEIRGPKFDYKPNPSRFGPTE